MALISDFGVDGNGIAQGMYRNRWKVNFLGFAGDSEPLRVNADTIGRPKITFEPITIDRYNSRAYVAGKHSFEPITMTVTADVGGTVSSAIQAQLELQQSIIGNFTAPRLPAAIGGAVYKFGIRQEMLDGNDTVLEAWLLEGCWFSSIEYGDLDYAASELVKYNLTITFDHARQIVSGINVKATGGSATGNSELIGS